MTIFECLAYNQPEILIALSYLELLDIYALAADLDVRLPPLGHSRYQRYRRRLRQVGGWVT